MRFNIIPMPLKAEFTKGACAPKAARCEYLGENIPSALSDLDAFFEKIKLENDGTLKLTLTKSKKLSEEGYELRIDKDAEIAASSAVGFFYGVQTLKQLIMDFWVKQDAPIPALTIYDAPKYQYRGFMLDVSRHFFDSDTVINLLDVLALHKINKFHFHITDDQGWRLEIKSYPHLTEKGAYRAETAGDKTPHGGFYTQEEMKRIVAYASDKHIEVIPEIDLPGHFTAAIAAYPELSCSSKPIEVATTFGIKPDIACAGKEETYTFFFKVIDELSEIFPSRFIHIGGDEAPKANWESCEACRAMMNTQGIASAEKLQGYMVNKIAEYIKGKDKTAIVWNESLNSGILDKDVICQYWSDGKEPLRVLKGLKEGRKTIISKFTPYYLDYPYGMHSLKAVYNFEPRIAGAEGFEDSIIGIESPLWTEYVKDKEKIDYQVFPRLTALSERAWSDSPTLDYADFEARLKEFYPLYSLYRIAAAPLKEVNPNKLKGIVQIIKFFTKAINRESVKAFFGSYKAARSVKAGRDGE